MLPGDWEERRVGWAFSWGFDGYELGGFGISPVWNIYVLIAFWRGTRKLAWGNEPRNRKMSLATFYFVLPLMGKCLEWPSAAHGSGKPRADSVHAEVCRLPAGSFKREQ